MKNIGTLKEWGLLIVIAIVIGLVMHFIVPLITFWQYFAAVLIIYFLKKLKDNPKTSTLGRICMWLMSIVFAFLVIDASLPMTVRSLPWSLKDTDVITAKAIADSIETKQGLIFSAARDRAKNAALKKYQKMLCAGQVDQAEKYMEKVHQIWNKEDIQHRLHPRPAPPTPIYRPAPAPAPTNPSINEERLVLRKGQTKFSSLNFSAGDTVIYNVIAGSAYRIGRHGKKVPAPLGLHGLRVGEGLSGPPAFEATEDNTIILVSRN